MHIIKENKIKTIFQCVSPGKLTTSAAVYTKVNNDTTLIWPWER